MTFPLILQVTDLANHLSEISAKNTTVAQANICLVDLRTDEAYTQGHIPGAVHGNAALLNRSESPVGGLLPDPYSVNLFLTEIGAKPGDHLVAYDEGLATPAARMIWVLDAYGYEASSWLNGGFNAWSMAHHDLSTEPVTPPPGTLSLQPVGKNLITVDELMQLTQKSMLHVLDVRSSAEYEGTDVRSAFGGHVPGAVHVEWTRLMDANGLLLSDEALQALLRDISGNSTDDTMIVYCQTHQRSAVTYVALKHLGYSDVRAIDGAWSSWGNREDTPKILGA